ncbi:hypothetical protein BDY21DRAFT_47130 [Lineolata rhizophorae]|uniref:Integral membrane protein n=1 Tax=Lineolata rhizophorae TaxID=578093 RepID=A0A6A6NZP7_9PEZI|nr:hypothetical protein BDY21DRAFT_47130 [Lineolata rhizophorae]
MLHLHQPTKMRLPTRLLPFTTLLLLLLLAPRPATSQAATVLLPGNALPPCALSCAALLAAQNACVPPALAATTALADQYACFCQQGGVQPLYASADGICTDVCTAEDERSRTREWFLQTCAGGGSETTSSASSSGVGTPTPGAGTPTGGSAAGETDAVGTVTGGGEEGGGQEGSWISTHYRWIIMLVVIAVGLALIAAIGVYLKRRHRRLRDAQGGNLAASDAVLNAPPPSGAAAAPGAAAPPPMSEASHRRSTISKAKGAMLPNMRPTHPGEVGDPAGIPPAVRGANGGAVASTALPRSATDSRPPSASGPKTLRRASGSRNQLRSPGSRTFSLSRRTPPPEATFATAAAGPSNSAEQLDRSSLGPQGGHAGRFAEGWSVPAPPAGGWREGDDDERGGYGNGHGGGGPSDGTGFSHDSDYVGRGWGNGSVVPGGVAAGSGAPLSPIVSGREVDVAAGVPLPATPTMGRPSDLGAGAGGLAPPSPVRGDGAVSPSEISVPSSRAVSPELRRQGSEKTGRRLSKRRVT